MDTNERIAALEAELAKVKVENEWLADERSRSLVDVEVLKAERDAALAALRECRSALWLVCHLPREYDLKADPHKVTLVTGQALAHANAVFTTRKESDDGP
jgi:hypothetical protein